MVRRVNAKEEYLESAHQSSAQAKVVLHVGGRVGQLRSLPVDLDGAHGEAVLHGHVDAATNQ